MGVSDYLQTLFDPRFMFLAVGMVVTGSLNTISTKIADGQCAIGIGSRDKNSSDYYGESYCDDGDEHQFDHPFFQAAGMFLGESLCLFAFISLYFYKKRFERESYQELFQNDDLPKLPIYLFLIPAMLDMTGTSLMYIGLGLTTASVFQMMRGSVVIFTGILSRIFLKRVFLVYNWIGMFLVLVGLLVVGLKDVIYADSGSGSGSGDDDSSSQQILGDIFVIAAQLIVAIQMVVEEKLLGKYQVPALKAVGLEGVFGFSVLTIGLIIMYWIPGFGPLDNPNRMENSIDAFQQIGQNWKILIALLGNIFSIAFFNFFGISMTKYSSATTRMVLDSIRTIVIWLFFLVIPMGKLQETFNWLEAVGFPILILGTFIYNEVGVNYYPEVLFWPSTKEETLRRLNSKIVDIDEDYDDYKAPLLDNAQEEVYYDNKD